MMNILSALKGKFLKERFSIGLDIGGSAIKLVKLRLLKDATELCGFNLDIITTSDLEAALKKIMQSQDTRAVNISFCGPSTAIRYVLFPRMRKEELKQSLKFEAEKYIPFLLTDINLDSYILKEELPDNKMLVLLAALKKDILIQRLKIMEAAGVRPYLADIDSLALVNVFNFNYQKDDNYRNKTIALLNIGASLSNLNILENYIPCLSRDIQIAGNNITQKLADTFSIDFKEAEALKLNPDKERLNKVTQAAESIVTNLASEIRTSFDYYETQSSASVVKIFLSGGGSLFVGLKDALVNLLGIEVEYWDPLKKITILDNVDSKKVRALSGQLAVAIGIAIRL